MTRAVTLALLVAALAVGTVAFGSLLPDMPSLTPVDGFDGPTDQPVDVSTLDLGGAS